MPGEVIKMNKPSMLTRLKSAIQFYQDGWRKFQLQPPQTKKIPFMWPTYYNQQPQWQLIDYQAYANEGFSANAVIYSAIMFRARAALLAPLRAYTGEPDKPEILPVNSPLQRLCLRPNRFQSQSEFMSQWWVYRCLSGNCFTVFVRSGGQITEMYNLRPDRVFIIPRSDRKEVIGYYYVPEGKSWHDGVPYLPTDVMHSKLPNPYDPLDGLGYGLSPLSPAARSGDVDNNLTSFLQLFFKHGAMPQGLLSYDVPMEDDQVAAARRRWNEIYGGYENWAEESVAVLDQGGKYQRVGFSFQEMDFAKIDARNESRLVGPFGVPLTLIESRPELVSSTYNNKETDYYMFWETIEEPELLWLQSDWQYYLNFDDNSYVLFDFEKTPAYQKRQNAKLDRIQRAFESGSNAGVTVVLPDEYRAALGFGPLQKQDIIDTVSDSNEEESNPPESEEHTEEVEEVVKSVKKKIVIDSNLFWTKADQMAVDNEESFNTATVDSFTVDMKYIEAMINDLNTESREHRSSLNWDTVIEAIAVYLTTKSLLNWQSNFTKPTTKLMTDRVSYLNEQYNESYRSAKLLSQEWFNEYMIQFAQPINETSEEQIRRLIENGRNEGASVPTVQKCLYALFDRWMSGTLPPDEINWIFDHIPDYRTENIVRTETMKALNTVSYRLYGAWGVGGHEWLATGDRRTRPDHSEANGQIRKIGEPFNVGGYSMMYPGDPAGPPSEICNCRCTTIPVIYE